MSLIVMGSTPQPVKTVVSCLLCLSRSFVKSDNEITKYTFVDSSTWLWPSEYHGLVYHQSKWSFISLISCADCYGDYLKAKSILPNHHFYALTVPQSSSQQVTKIPNKLWQNKKMSTPDRTAAHWNKAQPCVVKNIKPLTLLPSGNNLQRPLKRKKQKDRDQKDLLYAQASFTFIFLSLNAACTKKTQVERHIGHVYFQYGRQINIWNHDNMPVKCVYVWVQTP